jgi:hypothetical protein
VNSGKKLNRPNDKILQKNTIRPYGEKNRTGKYFKYAIGEIVLVVIGILIALSINNWNEERKVNETELQLLENLRNDLSFDINSSNTNDSIYSIKEKNTRIGFNLFLEAKTIQDIRKVESLTHAL